MALLWLRHCSRIYRWHWWTFLDSLGHTHQASLSFTPGSYKPTLPQFPLHFPSETLSILFWSWYLLYESVACRPYSSVSLSWNYCNFLPTIRPCLLPETFLPKTGHSQYFPNTPNYEMGLGAINLAVDFAYCMMDRVCTANHTPASCFISLVCMTGPFSLGSLPWTWTSN